MRGGSRKVIGHAVLVSGFRMMLSALLLLLFPHCCPYKVVKSSEFLVEFL